MRGRTAFFRLFKVIIPQIPIISLGVLADILKYGVTLLIGLLGVDLLRMAREGADASVLIPCGVLICILAVSRGVFGYLSPYLCHIGAYRLLADLRDQFYRILEPLAPAILMHRRTGDMVSVAGNNIETLELFFAHTIAPLITAIVIPILVFVSLFSIHPHIAVIYGIFTILILTLPSLAMSLNNERGEWLRVLVGDIHAFLIDSVQGIREILAFSRSSFRYNQVMDLNDAYQEEYGVYVQKNSIITAIYILLLSGGIISLLADSSLLTVAGSIDPLYLPIVVLFASVGFSSMANVIEISKQLSLTLAGAKRLYDLMDLKPHVTEPEQPVCPHEFQPSISVDGVSFRYSDTDVDVLQDISFDVPMGKTVALVGMTGAGKTTIAHLIMRFWDPVQGIIRVGGYDIRTLSLSYLLNMVAMVTQDIFLLNTSIMENIRLGRADASDGEVMAAALFARIHEFICSLPNGYHTIVGERGIRLSGGERQRIAIARAVLKNAPILIMDEATSALDTCTELEIREAMKELSMGRTVLIIAHRLSTIMHADQILVLREGKIVERGTHEELIRLNQVYTSLIKAQEI
ncbi:ABC transporter related protein [Methanospirillum hungatei JF-1]|uniref:ABC transporter related protein n=1 Tax=Methanospirillum hungatei JF-1 (strain ATCC 27890 / DSM 864 / NBRC 100397 / JF-1) TaxID=323259 RepID=Q2FMP1_METHJ|nr:ABC transporter ATP-binding protein [Methanospirillum hungatei]ABD39963.1 ABC transporter related protein [Methanospirillum hungatei JF-1]